MQGHDVLTDLIVRHNLAEFLGFDATFNMDNYLTLSALQGITARLAGAPPTANPAQWLRSQGYVAPVRGTGAPAQTEEVIYSLMILYEMYTGTRAETLILRDRGALSNIQGLNPALRSHIEAAFELNLYTNRFMQPHAPMTIEEFLRLLGILDQRIGLGNNR